MVVAKKACQNEVAAQQISADFFETSVARSE
jgi:hypothetical protein